MRITIQSIKKNQTFFVKRNGTHLQFTALENAKRRGINFTVKAQSMDGIEDIDSKESIHDSAGMNDDGRISVRC
jgi:hypothetical protein